MDLQRLDVLKFQERCNPIRDNCWVLERPITKNDVEKAIIANDTCHPESSQNLELHIARIAWFVIHGWDDPIHVDMGIPSLGCCPKWPLIDGNHRFAAAILRCDRVILAKMSGAVSEIETFLQNEPE